MSAQSTEKDYERGIDGDEEERSQMLEVSLEKGNIDLPSPVSATQTRPTNKPRLSTAVIIPIWIVLSSSVIIYNNYLYNTLQFRFPVFLVTFHLTFAVSRSRSITANRYKQISNRQLELVSCNGQLISSMVPRMFTSRKRCSFARFSPSACCSVVPSSSATPRTSTLV